MTQITPHRERSGERAYELFCWNAMIAFLITFRGARSAPHFRAASHLILVSAHERVLAQKIDNKTESVNLSIEASAIAL